MVFFAERTDSDLPRGNQSNQSTLQLFLIP
jgi:hypothetical protein